MSLPGHWTDIADDQLAFNTHILLGLAVDQFNEAVLACELFTPLFSHHVSIREPDSVAPSDSKEPRLISMYAKSFVCSLDATRSFLFVLARQPTLPTLTLNACRRFDQDFGYIRDIRNSIQHIEERALGLAQDGKALQVRFLLLGNFFNNRFGFTTDKGSYAEVEISEATLQKVRTGLEQVIGSINWLGPGSAPIPCPEVGGA